MYLHTVHRALRVASAGLMALVLVVLSGCAGNAQQASTGEYIDDTVITAKVKTAIADDLGLASAADINVETFKGTVQLSGFTDSSNEKLAAGRIAASIDGVQAVENKISVK